MVVGHVKNELNSAAHRPNPHYNLVLRMLFNSLTCMRSDKGRTECRRACLTTTTTTVPRPPPEPRNRPQQRQRQQHHQPQPPQQPQSQPQRPTEHEHKQPTPINATAMTLSTAVRREAVIGMVHNRMRQEAHMFRAAQTSCGPHHCLQMLLQREFATSFCSKNIIAPQTQNPSPPSLPSKED